MRPLGLDKSTTTLGRKVTLTAFRAGRLGATLILHIAVGENTLKAFCVATVFFLNGVEGC